MRLKHPISMLILASALTLSGFAAGPQQAGQDQSGQSGSTEGETNQMDRLAAVPPDIAGPESLSPGSVQREPTFFLPTLQFFEQANSNSAQTTGTQRFGTLETIVVGLGGECVGKHSLTIAEYRGGYSESNQQSTMGGWEHQAGVTWNYQGTRWNWLVDERASFLPQSAYGYVGFGWTGDPGVLLLGLSGTSLETMNPNFTAEQSLFAGYGNRFVDATAMAGEYVLSPRSMVSVSGSYSELTFLKRAPPQTTPNIDSTRKLASLSYNHSLTAQDYVGLSYGFNLFQFQPLGRSFKTHYVQFWYAHRVRGKASFSLGGGPEFLTVNAPFFGSSSSTSWVANTSMGWHSSRNSFALTAARYTSNGGGILVGSFANTVKFSWSHQLGRKWRGSVGPGYAHNTTLPQTFSFLLLQPKATYDSTYAEASLSRSFGRNTHMFLQYDLQNQTAQIAGASRNSYLNHVLELGFDWHRRPIGLD